MPDFDDAIYDFRTMAERVNARLKDEFGARFQRVRGALKVRCHLMFGIVALAVDQIIRVVDLRSAPASITLARRRGNSPRSGVLQEAHVIDLSRACLLCSVPEPPTQPSISVHTVRRVALSQANIWSSPVYVIRQKEPIELAGERARRHRRHDPHPPAMIEAFRYADMVSRVEAMARMAGTLAHARDR
jgi:hypothetical protein